MVKIEKAIIKNFSEEKLMGYMGLIISRINETKQLSYYDSMILLSLLITHLNNFGESDKVFNEKLASTAKNIEKNFDNEVMEA